ncbi:MAG TPA: FHA domain-containing protein, partial [Vicinamibacteria bacterium]|nr:FHA domain-containing protein [Vicinamibacteria bacterium]
PRPEPPPLPAPPVPVGEGGGTLKWIDGPPPAETGPSVEFSAGVPARKVEDDDTKEIVSKNAARYLANATRVTVSRLVLIKDGVETSFPLIKDSYTLGRHRNNDIVISDPKASSFHARIDRSPDGFVIVDLQSRNGSWLNSKRVETALLKTGDDVRLGMARLIYKVDYTSAV